MSTGIIQSERPLQQGQESMLDWLRSALIGETRVRGYELEEQIFAGSFSDIFKAYDTKRQQLVVLKLLTAAGSRIAKRLDNNLSTRWEGDLLSRLDHPNIVKCFECGELAKKKGYWIAMEYVPSKLGHYIGRCSNEEEENELLDILGQITSAISYLHSLDLMHRDICLSNILLTPEATVKLIDFGLTIPVDSSVLRGRAGTPSYMAPEMIKKWMYTPATDIYSFGVVMYELITGHKPFAGRLPEQRMTRSLNVHPLPPSRMEQYCDPELEQLMMKCLSKDPEERARTAREVENGFFLIRRRRGLA